MSYSGLGVRLGSEPGWGQEEGRPGQAGEQQAGGCGPGGERPLVVQCSTLWHYERQTPGKGFPVILSYINNRQSLLPFIEPFLHVSYLLESLQWSHSFP